MNLEDILREVIANKFVMYFKAHSYHWNVEGIHFSQLHDFFGDIYADVFGAVDTAAEELRALDTYAPISLMELYNHKTVTEDTTKPESVGNMLINLAVANAEVISSLNKLFTAATAASQQGLADFAAGRIDVHKKHAWMIKSSMPRSGE
jgi:starvation-inducible DNA-binding protein